VSNVTASEILLKRLISTNGLAVRKSIKDEAFWYTSCKPGPFYINTENIAGQVKANEVLNSLDNILKGNLSIEQQSKAIYETVNQVVVSDDAYGASIDALLAYYLEQNNNPTLISGGERRDWFFSIPIAKKLKIPHIYLFKSGVYHVTDHKGNSIPLEISGHKVLHVADIINQASSYLNRWIPILKRVGVDFTETLSVTVRSQEGIDKLKEYSISVISPLVVDIRLFKEAYNLSLINEFSYNEIMQFYDSPREWTRQYIAESSINNYPKLYPDKIKEARIQSFLKNDPYHLKTEIPLYFAK
jgi:orotate phosphoribosyltransferase